MREPQPLSAEFFCSSCRTPFQNSFPLDAEGRCALCRNGLRGFDAAYCFGAYEGVLRELIHLYKYGKVRTLAGPLSALLAQALPRDEAFDAMVPVPLYWRRRWQRGFNQSELLARGLSPANRHSRGEGVEACAADADPGGPEQHTRGAEIWPRRFDPSECSGKTHSAD